MVALFLCRNFLLRSVVKRMSSLFVSVVNEYIQVDNGGHFVLSVVIVILAIEWMFSSMAF